jgi:hypothetical protein
MMSPVIAASRQQQSPSGPPANGVPAAAGDRATGVPASPSAARAPGRSWRDPRLVVGIVIVAVSVLLGARLLASADDTVAVWSVAGDLSAGSVLSDADLERVDLRFGTPEVAGRYLAADTALPAGSVLTRDVVAGELLPRAAVGNGDPVDLLEVPLAVAAEAVPATLRAGEVVDVWVTPAAMAGQAPRAVRVLDQVRVVAVPRSGSALGPSATRQVVVGLEVEDETRLAMALARLSDGAAVIVRRG